MENKKYAVKIQHGLVKFFYNLIEAKHYARVNGWKFVYVYDFKKCDYTEKIEIE